MLYLGVLLAAGGLIVLAYRVSRTHAAARYPVRTGRKPAWSHTVRLTAGVAAMIVGLLLAGFELAR